jgi:hypothetical protein
MSLQNRVNPFSSLIATPERGAWTGNRGVIHNPEKKIVKNHAIKAWICCVLDYKDFRRQIMSPNRWTELFFLDEATAFAAGHRPCGFCRHPDFKRFKSLWLSANREQYGLQEGSKMDAVDAFIHQERLDKNGRQRTFKATLSDLPDGCFITRDDELNSAYLWHQKQLFSWSFSGYSKVTTFDKNQEVNVLTPQSFVAVFKAGYVPQIHSSTTQIDPSV